MKRTAAGASMLLILLIITAATLGLCLKASKTPAEVPKTRDPRTTVAAFFDALGKADYAVCDRLLYQCGTLGLEKVPGDETQAILWKAMLGSLSCEIDGEPETNADSAVVRVKLTGLSFPKAAKKINEAAKKNIEYAMNNVQQDDRIFDENGEYLEEFITAQYEKSVAQVMESPEEFYRESELKLDLKYIDGQWKIVVTDDLARALTGSKMI